MEEHKELEVGRPGYQLVDTPGLEEDMEHFAEEGSI